MPRIRKRWLAILLGCLLLGGAGAIRWLAWTEAGLSSLVAMLESLDAVQVSVDGESGKLAGPLHVDLLELQAGRVTLRAEAVDLDHGLLALAFGRLAVKRLHADAVRLVIGPATGPPADGQPTFMPRWLSLDLDDAQIDRLDIVLPDASELHYTDVRAAGSVTHARIDLKEAALDAGSWAASGSVGLVAREPLRLHGELTWSVRGQPELRGLLRAKGDLDRLDASVELVEPAAVAADLTVTDLDGDLRWEARVDTQAFDLSPWVAEPPVGPLSGFLEGSGSLVQFEIEGHVGGSGLPADGLNLQARLLRQGSALTFEPLHVATPDGRLDTSTTGTLHLDDEPSLQLRSQWTGLAWPLDRTAAFTSRRGTLDLQGWDVLSFAADATVSLAGVPETRIVAGGQADRSGITLTRSALSGTAGRAEATGYLGFGTDMAWQLAATVRDLDLGRFRTGLDSRLGFELGASGEGTGQQAAWAASVGSIAGSLRGYAVSGKGFVVQNRGRYDFRDFDFRVGPAELEVSGHVGGETDLVAQLVVPDLGGLFDEAGGSLDATIKAHTAGAPLADRPNLRLDVSMRGRDLRWGEQTAAVLSADADIDLSDRETSWTRLRAAGLTLAGQPVSSLRLSLDGLARQHDLDLQVGSGARAVSLIGSGQFLDGGYTLAASRLESDDPKLHPYSLEAPMQLAVSASSARLAETCIVYSPRRICLQAQWDSGSGWSALGSVEAFPLEALRVDLPRQPGYRGRLDATLSAEGPAGQPWTATARGLLSEAALHYKTPSGRLEEVDLGVTNFRLDSLPDRHELQLTTQDSDALQLRAAATLVRDEALSLGQSPLQGTLKLSMTRLGLLPLLVPEIDKASGTLNADLSLGGTPSQPVAGGTVQLENGELDLYATNLRLRELGARVVLLETGLRLESSGKAGGGSFRTDGELVWQDNVLHGDIRLSGEKLLVADIPEVRVEASPDLAFRIDGRDIAVTGTVTIPRARIEPKDLVGAVTVSPDEHIVRADLDEVTTAGGYRVGAKVRLVLGDDVQLSAFGLRGRLEGSVLTQMRPDEVTTASGELEIQDGKYEAYSKELDVERGRLLFAGGPVTDPGVDLRASKTVPGYTVGVAVRGRLRRPELSLFSDPPMPQSQIASLLLVGRRLDSLDASDRRALGGSAGDMATQGGAILAGQLVRYIGVDELSLETDADTADSELVIGKFLSPRLYISYGISLANAINTFKLRYTIGDRWVISGEAGQEASVDVEYTIDR